MSSFNAYLKEQLKDPAVKAEYDALEPEFSIIHAMIDARKASGKSSWRRKPASRRPISASWKTATPIPRCEPSSVWPRAWACISGWNSCPMRDVLSHLRNMTSRKSSKKTARQNCSLPGVHLLFGI